MCVLEKIVNNQTKMQLCLNTSSGKLFLSQYVELWTRATMLSHTWRCLMTLEIQRMGGYFRMWIACLQCWDTHRSTRSLRKAYILRQFPLECNGITVRNTEYLAFWSSVQCVQPLFTNKFSCQCLQYRVNRIKWNYIFKLYTLYF